ncbi:Ribonuclease H [Yarrowia sp. B02]|nr:Ribonuclease H [Yarrowia sp. B02]
MRFYAVRKGYQPGIYNSWDECQEQVKGFPGFKCKGFTSRQDAEDFMNGKEFPSNKQAKEKPKPKRLFAGVEHPDNQSRPLSGYVHSSNRAALEALLQAYKLIRQRNDSQHYGIRTNSLYAINCTTVWCRTWMQNGWKNSKRKTVQNADIIRAILAENSAMPGTDKVTLKHAHKDEKHLGEKEAKKLPREGVNECRDVLCSCGKVLVHVKEEY